MQALLGDDAEIVAAPVGPQDQKVAPKAGAYLTWRLFEYMRATPALSAWLFRVCLFGRAHAYVPYEQEYFWERDEEGNDSEVLCYDGPKIIPLWPAEIIVPAQDGVQSVDDFEWVIRRLRLTPQQLMDGERRGRYQGVTDRWEEIYSHAQQRQERDYTWDDEKMDSDQAEGVDFASLMGARDSIEAWQWYGKWRLPKGKQDSRPDNFKRRHPNESELLVTYLPRPGLIIGVQDLRDLYPRMRRRKPFASIGLVKDGSYWCPGLGEMIETLQSKSSANYRLFEKAGQFSVGPVIFYRPSSGFDPETFEYRPGLAIPTEDPAGVNPVAMKADLSFSQLNNQWLKGMAELVTGVSDQTLGQTIDRPNAPRTATGQIALIEQGNVRASLDMSMLRDDLSVLLEYIWSLDREYAGEEVFFRATEEDAGGLFETKGGFGTMTAQEREHAFDFQLKFATSVFSKEAKKQQTMQLYGLAMQNPIVATNPRALWVLLNKIWEAMGESNFRDVVPEPPQLETPKRPQEEWAMVLQGEEISVNPLDDDVLHLTDHRRRLEGEMVLPEERRDRGAEAAIVTHILEHEQQRRQKMLLAAITEQLKQQVMQSQQGQSGGPMAAPQQAAGVPVSSPVGGPGPVQQPGSPSGVAGPQRALDATGASGVGGPA